MANTGIKTVLTLRKYVDGVATSEVKINDPADPDYIAPYEDLVDCPVSGGVTPTTVAPTTATPTTQAQTTQAQTTQAQTTQAQTTQAQTTQAQTTQAQTTQAQTTQAQTTQAQTTQAQTTQPQTTQAQTTQAQTTQSQTTQSQTTQAQTTQSQTTQAQTTQSQTTQSQTTQSQTTQSQTTQAQTTVQATTTTTIDYTYYYAEPCGGGSTVYFRSTTAMTFGEAIKIDAYGDNCYTVGTSGAPITSNEVTASYPDCEACNPSTTQTPTTIPSTTAAPSGDCTTYLLQNTSGIGTVGFSFTGCGPDAGRNATTVTADGRETVCSSTVPTSSSQNAGIEDLGACGSVSTTIQPTTAAPAALQEFFTTGTAEVTSTDACQVLVSARRWHNGSGFIPAFGDTVYLFNSTTGGTLSQGFWGTDQGVYYRTDSGGIVIETGPCGGGGFN